MLIRDILDHAVKLYPTKTALVDGDLELTYAQAHERVHRLASGLLSLGLKPGDLIAILANNSRRYWETYFVADIAGMPLAPLNIRLAANELEFILNDSDVKAILVGAEYLELYRQFHKKTPKIEHVVLLDDARVDGMVNYEELIAGSEPLSTSVRSWDENEMLNLCYTGGTTGLPKGVMLSQRNVVSNAQHVVMTAGFQERDVWLHAAPMFHLADAWACYSVTMVGGTLVQGGIDVLEGNLALEARIERGSVIQVTARHDDRGVDRIGSHRDRRDQRIAENRRIAACIALACVLAVRDLDDEVLLAGKKVGDEIRRARHAAVVGAVLAHEILGDVGKGNADRGDELGDDPVENFDDRVA